MQRAPLVSSALALGFSEEEVNRATTYTLVTMIKERTQKQKKRTPKEEVDGLHEREHHHHSDGGRPPQDQPLTGGWGPKDQPSQGWGPKDHAVDVDDTKTVVNMEFATSTTNPSDQKYKKFSVLIAAKNDLTASIKRNAELLHQTKQRLDQDDVDAFEREIKTAQYHLGLVQTEMREIRQWFAEAHSEQLEFYKDIVRTSADLSGELRSHFQRKMENIQKYMAVIDEQSQVRPEDIRQQ